MNLPLLLSTLANLLRDPDTLILDSLQSKIGKPGVILSYSTFQESSTLLMISPNLWDGSSTTGMLGISWDTTIELHYIPFLIFRGASIVVSRVHDVTNTRPLEFTSIFEHRWHVMSAFHDNLNSRNAKAPSRMTLFIRLIIFGHQVITINGYHWFFCHPLPILKKP